MEDLNEKFLEMLKDSSIENERKNILPSFRGEKKRLDISVIKKIFNDEDLDTTELETDFDVWLALKNLKKRSDVLYVLKDCLKEANITCNDAELNKLKKDQFIELLFNVFEIYPKANEENKTPEEINLTTNSAIETDTPDENNKKVRDSKAKIFPGGVIEGQEIEYSEIADMLPEKVSSIDELKNLMLSTEAGNKVKDMFKSCCRMKNISFDSGKLGGIERKIYVPIFFDVFKINFPQTELKSNTPTSKSPTIRLSLTFEQAQSIYDASEKISVSELEGYDICDNVTVYRDMPITLSDGFWVKIPDDISYLCTAIINSQTNEVTAVGSIEEYFVSEKNIRPHLIFDSNLIRYEHFERQREFKVMFIPSEHEHFLTTPTDNYQGKVYIFECDFNLDTLKDSTSPLCIDFGTSNTTAGTYGLDGGGNNEIQLVKFRDVTSVSPKITEMLPTVVYVDSFENDKPVYKFGYEAHKEIIESNYSTRASVFYEIKRWINSIDETEKLFDKNGNKIPHEISHREILKAYLDYVIKIAQQQFKVKFHHLHFTAPVKLKKQFLKIMSEIFPKPEYYIEKEQRSLDEGVAIVYHYISERLHEIDTEKEASVSDNILILDCGGGTTDLVSCKYSIEKTDIGPELRIESGFENGDSNFGGNDITFRILQMLKIKIAAHLERQGNLTMQELIVDNENTILSKIDEDYAEKDKIYEKFIKAYEQAENIIPTKFSKYSGRNEKLMVKRNFYYLWQMAEAIKIAFYRSNLVNVDFDKEEDKKIYVDNTEQYYLYIKAEGQNLVRREHPMDKVEITIKEINRIICPDIYALLSTFLRQYTGSKLETISELQKFHYRLSGQSCKIALFNDLLKEFIPGILLRDRTPRESNFENNRDSSNLKMFCIKGSIEYMRDKERGEIKPELIAEITRNIYAVYLEENGKISECALNHDGTVTLIKRPSNMREAVFIVQDSNKRKKNRLIYSFNMDDSQPTYTLEQFSREIEKSTSLEFSKINQMICDPLRDISFQRNNSPVCCIFVLPARDRYGFYIWQVIVMNNENGKYYRSPGIGKFEIFEDERLQTFFNGDN